MVKGMKERLDNEKKMAAAGGFADSCKLFLVGSLLLICLAAAAAAAAASASFRFLPFNRSSFLSLSDFRFNCLVSTLSATTPQNSSDATTTLLPKSLEQKHLVVKRASDDLVVKRAFTSLGSAAYLFVQMGAYRGGLNTFAVVGLASKPIHVFSNADFRCEWVPHNNRSAAANATSYKMLPDWGYGRVYTVVVVNCTFAADVGADGSGGQLVVTATVGGGGRGVALRKEEEVPVRFVAMEEMPGAVNMSVFASPPKYDYLYCGSSLYGTLSPQRVREWMAYHVKLFGPRSHFVIHDAGGVQPEVMEVLRPWVEKGFVTLQDIRDQERFDGYYHNQFLVVNDCLHRYRHHAKWMFFFDVDEFIYVEPTTNLDGLMESLSRFTQFTIQQMPMSSNLCLSHDAGKNRRMWGIEKLVYKDVKRGIRRDRKYTIQPRNAFSVGVHLSQNFAGKTTYKTEGRIKYYHYHGTIANRQEPCREFVNETELTYKGTPYYRDETLRQLASSIKRFELKTIGKRLVRTRQ